MLLKKGSRGNDVRTLQKLLNLQPDGIFGILTEEAVKDFQRENGLKVDGIVGDATWARLTDASTLKTSKRSINEIIVHCTATKEGVNCDIDTIRKWHKARGFSDIGYHYVIYLDGSVHTGRDVNISGAHCLNHNTHSIGVCYVGGLDNNNKAKDTRTVKQKEALSKLLASLKILYPKARIIGHRDTSPDLNGNGLIEPNEWVKDCPSFDARKEYVSLSGLIK